jgi:hypothetical protein
MKAVAEPSKEHGSSNEDSHHDDDAVDTESIRPAPPRGSTSAPGDLYRAGSHVSHHDTLEPPSHPQHDQYHEAGDEVYNRLTKGRKIIIVAVLSFCAFLSPVSSTSVLAATPEVAREYGTTGSVINLSNAAYMALMGLSPIVWGPMSQVFGRRPVS